MPPTAKDLDVTTSSPQTPVTPAASGGADSAGRPQPVPLEVPVTVNGARTVQGSDKREPFSEATQTVLVFGNGAVIRLASTVAPGQLLFLTNDKTKKEVVCQVVKSKNYRNVSGYVELEFTEAVAGFWGMRFPGERVTAQPLAPAPTQVAAKSPVAPAPPAPKVEAPAPSNLPKRAETQPAPAPPVRTETVTTTALRTEVKPALNLPRAADPARVTTPPKAPAVPNSFGSSVTTTSRTPESKPPAPVVPKAPAPPVPPALSVNTQASTDALKRESARLQEQLSSMHFTPAAPAKPAQPASPPPSANRPVNADSPAKVIEMARPQPPAARAIPPVVAPVKSAPVPAGSTLDAEETKIPSWLEPLARNAAVASHNEVATKEETAPADDIFEFEVQDVSAPGPAQEIAIVPPAESGMDILSLPPADGHVSAKNNKTILIGAIAAGFLVLAAGGTWYLRQPSGPAQGAVAVASAPATSNVAAVQPPTKGAVDAPTAARANVNSGAALPPVTSSQVSPQSASPTAQPLKSAPDKSTMAELSAYKKLAEPPPPVAQPQPKKSGLGEVHLAAPAVNHRAAAPAGGEVDFEPILGAGQPTSTGDALGGGLAAGNEKQPAAPAAPLAVGGDVKQAHLLSSTPPSYPMLAKSQHIEGNVRIDAVVDATGRISSMKVVSGPTLLHQAAMDALRQWKYLPATLDGKPVPMHLTVTLQFRLQ